MSGFVCGRRDSMQVVAVVAVVANPPGEVEAAVEAACALPSSPARVESRVAFVVGFDLCASAFFGRAVRSLAPSVPDIHCCEVI